MVLRKANDDGHLRESIAARVGPKTAFQGRQARCGPLGTWGGAEEDEVGRVLPGLMALLAVQEVAEVMEEEKEKACEGRRFKGAKGNVGNGGPVEKRESEDAESEESEPEDQASEERWARRLAGPQGQGRWRSPGEESPG